MPTATGSRPHQDHAPQYTSPCARETNMEGRERTPAAHSDLVGVQQPYANQPPRETTLLDPGTQHKYHDSTSIQASESTDSSPTTTISTADSCSTTETSPNSSPESPITIIPLSSYTSSTFGLRGLDDLTMSNTPVGHHALSYDRPMTSPGPRKPRNAKGLALNLSPSQMSSHLRTSAPASPSFVKPEIPKARKKPSILSLQTSAATPLQPRLTFEPPPTPGAIRTTTIRHAHSSPQLLYSPARSSLAGPEGGMQLPHFERSRISGLSSTFRRPSTLKESTSMGPDATIEEEDSPIRTQMATRSMADIRGDAFDVPISQEDAKSPGYPDGPVMIYEPNVYLYLEPTAEEARKFDVVVNVAQEVKNPFKTEVQPSPGPPPMDRSWPVFDPMDLEDRDDVPEPDTAVSLATFKTAFEFQPSDAPTGFSDTSSITPKASEVQPVPEYIHVPWEHNTDIAKDLMGLCELIDSRAKEGKKVLIHCQQGASRSASLIIAYGMYTNPELSVNDAYHAAQARSRWISPNMKLMYALQDFQKDVEKKKQGASGIRSRSGRSPTKHRTTLSADAIEFSPKEPQTAPLPSENGGMVRSKSPAGSPNRSRGHSTPSFGGVSPGPSSAPSAFSWVPRFDRTPELAGPDPEPRLLDDFGPSIPHPPSPPRSVPPLSSSSRDFHASGFASHRVNHNLSHLGLSSLSGNEPPISKGPTSVPTFANLPPKQQFASHSVAGDVPPTPSLFSPGFMSPRVAEFSINPFHPPLPVRSIGSLVLPPASVDPRSPATKGEAPIIRSIDEFL
jgi:tyrosine-protein phosphatase